MVGRRRVLLNAGIWAQIGTDAHGEQVGDLPYTLHVRVQDELGLPHAGSLLRAGDAWALITFGSGRGPGVWLRSHETAGRV